LTRKTKKEQQAIAAGLNQADIGRIVEMAWEDRTPFEAIESSFGLSESHVIDLMRTTMQRSSFRMWRARVSGRVTKHKALRADEPHTHRAQHRRHPNL
jgi:uncharacterized protein (TIGR03643 family)